MTALAATCLASGVRAADWQRPVYDSATGRWVVGRDSDDSGSLDDIRFDLNGNGVWDAQLYNAVGTDELLENFGFDWDEDGTWDLWVIDTDQVVGFDCAWERQPSGQWLGYGLWDLSDREAMYPATNRGCDVTDAAGSANPVYELIRVGIVPRGGVGQIGGGGAARDPSTIPGLTDLMHIIERSAGIGSVWTQPDCPSRFTYCAP
jgi:hypothetical protein